MALAAQSGVFASGSAPSQAALRAARDQLTHDGTLQFTFDKVVKPPPTHLPHWLEALLRAIGGVIQFVAPALGWIFIGGLVAALAVVLFFLGREFMKTRWPGLFKRKAAPAGPDEWRPAPSAARALLDEADRLAAAGRYAEAVRLILHRSIEEIDGRRPRLVRPALTAREIGGLEGIPQGARTTFGAIAGLVEHSFFAGRSVDADGFAACRRAYEAFAFPGAWA
ncbi:MAG TPA: hypothetical protein VGG29_19455 [Caulobacteraceae bacterium]